MDDRGAYAWNSEEYARHSKTQFEWAMELIAKLHLRGNEVVLDIGCGDGQATALLARAVPKGTVLGIDSSPDMIERAQQQHATAGYPNLSFVRMDARVIDFENRFDVIFSNATLHWVLDHRPVLAGVKKALRPGGRILFQMGGRGNAREIIRIAGAMIRSDRWAEFFRDFSFPYGFFGPEEYREWLTQAGLRPVRVELVPKDMKQSGRDELAAWIRTTWLPYTERIPDSRRENFIRELANTYIAGHPVDSNGLVHVDMVRLEVEAVNETV